MARTAQSDGTVGEPNRRAIRLRTTARTGTAVRTGTIERAACWSCAVRDGSAIADSRHSGTISSTFQVRRTGWNAMKPWVQCARAQ
jgi:hypothetical protein